MPQADHHIAAAGTVREESPDKGAGISMGGSMGAAPVEEDAFDADFDIRDAPSDAAETKPGPSAEEIAAAVRAENGNTMV